jgi:uncharacterized damage-inducible protein DinB
LKFSLALPVCALLALPLIAADESKLQAKFAAEYGKHWKTARDLTLAVADAMPADGYGLKPDPGEMSFGEQISHIAQANYGYCSAFTKAKSPFTKPANFDKETVMKLTGDSFDYCSEIIGALTEDQLNEMRGPEGRQSSLREVMLGAFTHMAHHRGQAEVYLRVKGIKPPQYKF